VPVSQNLQNVAASTYSAFERTSTLLTLLILKQINGL
jgi:hypothetical protein